MFGPEEPSCELETIQKLGDQACQFVQQYCEHESLFNFFSVHYCQFGGASYITIPIYLFIIFLCFYIVGTTAEGFLSPALEKVASTLGMSESLAGVTLLAMGNGAPDVLTSVSAAGSEHTGMFFSVGSLAGSGLFVTGVVTAFVIIFSPRTIKVPGLSILRDV